MHANLSAQRLVWLSISLACGCACLSLRVAHAQTLKDQLKEHMSEGVEQEQEKNERREEEEKKKKKAESEKPAPKPRAPESKPADDGSGVHMAFNSNDDTTPEPAPTGP